MASPMMDAMGRGEVSVLITCVLLLGAVGVTCWLAAGWQGFRCDNHDRSRPLVGDGQQMALTHGNMMVHGHRVPRVWQIYITICSDTKRARHNYSTTKPRDERTRESLAKLHLRHADGFKLGAP